MTTPAPEVRLAPVPFDQWDDETRATLLAFLRRPELYLSGAPDAPPIPVVMELFAHHVPLTETFLAFTDALAGETATLEPRIRELLILRVASRTGSGYEWSQHARMAREAGLSEAQVSAVAEGPGAAMWGVRERTILVAVDEMLDGYEVSDETWRALAASFDPAQLLELLFVVGGYLALAAVLNSIGLRGALPADVAGGGVTGRASP
jgi:4-carboxymuconolactone decarboxylase